VTRRKPQPRSNPEQPDATREPELTSDTTNESLPPPVPDTAHVEDVNVTSDDDFVGMLRKLETSVNGLAARAQSLETVTVQQRNSLQQQKKRTDTDRRVTRMLIASITLDIILSVFLAISYFFISDNQSTLQAVQDHQNASTELTRTNLCAMTNMFLLYAQASPRTSATLTPEELKQRQSGYATIKQIHDNLNCPN
jgi:hypothetical protein